MMTNESKPVSLHLRLFEGAPRKRSREQPREYRSVEAALAAARRLTRSDARRASYEVRQISIWTGSEWIEIRRDRPASKSDGTLWVWMIHRDGLVEVFTDAT